MAGRLQAGLLQQLAIGGVIPTLGHMAPLTRLGVENVATPLGHVGGCIHCLLLLA